MAGRVQRRCFRGSGSGDGLGGSIKRPNFSSLSAACLGRETSSMRVSHAISRSATSASSGAPITSDEALQLPQRQVKGRALPQKPVSHARSGCGWCAAKGKRACTGYATPLARTRKWTRIEMCPSQPFDNAVFATAFQALARGQARSQMQENAFSPARGEIEPRRFKPGSAAHDPAGGARRKRSEC